jgi:hypothetical protein
MMMNLKADRPRYLRRKTDLEAWENTIESLAMDLCPAEEWQAYQRQLMALSQVASSRAQKSHARQAKGSVRVFPIWKKYRQKALQVATLYQAVPLLRHLPLRVSSFLGDVLFK